MVEDGFFCFSGFFGQQLQLLLRRAALTPGVGKVFRKMLAPQLQNPLLEERLLRPFFGLFSRTWQDQSPPQCPDRRVRSSFRAWVRALLYRTSAAWVERPYSVAISLHKNPSRRR
jgi:hypothetical protein